MSEYFRIVRGLEIDDSVRILQGAGVPGVSADTSAAQVGSFYLDTANGASYSKVAPGAGATKWSGVGQVLYAERPVSATLPAADADNSVAIGAGAMVEATADGAIALGSQSLARHIGSQVFANGRFGSAGDAQAGKYLLRTHTVNAAPTEAFLDGTAGIARLVLPDDSTWTFTATITGHRQDVGDGHAGYKVAGVIYRGAGAASTAIQGAVIKSVLAESNPQWDINITADTTNGSLKVEVIGQASKIIRWVALIETVEVTN